MSTQIHSYADNWYGEKQQHIVVFWERMILYTAGLVYSHFVLQTMRPAGLGLVALPSEFLYENSLRWIVPNISVDTGLLKVSADF